MLLPLQERTASSYVDNCIFKEDSKNSMFLWRVKVRNSLWNILEFEIFLPYVMCFNEIIMHAKSHRSLTWASPQSSVN